MICFDMFCRSNQCHAAADDDRCSRPAQLSRLQKLTGRSGNVIIVSDHIAGSSSGFHPVLQSHMLNVGKNKKHSGMTAADQQRPTNSCQCITILLFILFKLPSHTLIS
jgi:hypothetical protein